MGFWKFYVYEDKNGVDQVGAWYASQTPEVQNQFDQTLMLLAAIDRWDLLEDERGDKAIFKVLGARDKGLGEIRFGVRATNPDNKKQYWKKYRPVGPWPTSQPYKFIILIACEKPNQGQYVPHNAFGIATALAEELLEGKGTVYEWT